MQEEVKHMSQNKNDMIYVLEQHECIPTYCVLYKLRSTLAVSQSGFSQPSWPGVLPSLFNSFHPLLGPLHSRGRLRAGFSICQSIDFLLESCIFYFRFNFFL